LHKKTTSRITESSQFDDALARMADLKKRKEIKKARLATVPSSIEQSIGE
jgi:hypothetical protein